MLRKRFSQQKQPSGLVNPTIYQNQLEELGQHLRQSLQQRSPWLQLQVRCAAKQDTLLILIEHLLHIEPDPALTFADLEAALPEKAGELFQSGFAKSLVGDASSIPVRAFLRISGYQQPYAVHSFALEPSPIAAPPAETPLAASILPSRPSLVEEKPPVDTPSNTAAVVQDETDAPTAEQSSVVEDAPRVESYQPAAPAAALAVEISNPDSIVPSIASVPSADAEEAAVEEPVAEDSLIEEDATSTELATVSSPEVDTLAEVSPAEVTELEPSSLSIEPDSSESALVAEVYPVEIDQALPEVISAEPEEDSSVEEIYESTEDGETIAETRITEVVEPEAIAETPAAETLTIESINTQPEALLETAADESSTTEKPATELSVNQFSEAELPTQLDEVQPETIDAPSIETAVIASQPEAATEVSAVELEEDLPVESAETSSAALEEISTAELDPSEPEQIEPEATAAIPSAELERSEPEAIAAVLPIALDAVEPEPSEEVIPVEVDETANSTESSSTEFSVIEPEVIAQIASVEETALKATAEPLLIDGEAEAIVEPPPADVIPAEVIAEPTWVDAIPPEGITEPPPADVIDAAIVTESPLVDTVEPEAIVEPPPADVIPAEAIAEPTLVQVSEAETIVELPPADAIPAEVIAEPTLDEITEAEAIVEPPAADVIDATIVTESPLVDTVEPEAIVEPPPADVIPAEIIAEPTLVDAIELEGITEPPPADAIPAEVIAEPTLVQVAEAEAIAEPPLVDAGESEATVESQITEITEAEAIEEPPLADAIEAEAIVEPSAGVKETEGIAEPPLADSIPPEPALLTDTSAADSPSPQPAISFTEAPADLTTAAIATSQPQATEPPNKVAPVSAPPSAPERRVVAVEQLVSPARSRWSASSIMLAGSVGLFAIVSGAYVLTRPCVLGSICEPLQKAQQLDQQANQTITSTDSALRIAEAYDQLNEARTLLGAIPVWSGQYQTAQALQSDYDTKAEVLGQVVRALKQANTAALSSQNPPHPLQDWRKIQWGWREAIALLEKVPPDSPVAALAQKKLQEYQVNLDDTDARVMAEQAAQDKVTTARSTARIAEARAGSAASPESWQQVYLTWEAAIDLLRQVPEGTMAHVEAQKLVTDYQTKMTAARERRSQEASSTGSLQEAINFAEQARGLEQQNKWAEASLIWQEALNTVQRIPQGTSYYSRAQVLLSEYQTALTGAKQNQQRLSTMQKIKPDLDRTCAGNPRVCTYTFAPEAVRIQITPEYNQVIEGKINSSQLRGNFSARTTAVNQVNQLLVELSSLSETAQVPIELYNSNGTKFGIYAPSPLAQ